MVYRVDTFRTPGKPNSNDELNSIIDQLERCHRIGLVSRRIPKSPGDTPKTKPNRIVNGMQYLFFSKRSELDQILREFDSLAHGCTADEKRDLLLELMRPHRGHHPVGLENKTPIPSLGRNLTAAFLDVKQSGESRDDGQNTSKLPLRGDIALKSPPVYSIPGSSMFTPTQSKFSPHRNSINVLLDEDDFQTAPQSPSPSSSKSEHLQKRRKKRPSEEYGPDKYSPKATRTSSESESASRRSSEIMPKPHAIRRSFGSQPSTLPSASFASTAKSVQDSFASQSGADTANTSFMSTLGNTLERDGPKPFRSSGIDSLDDSALIEFTESEGKIETMSNPREDRVEKQDSASPLKHQPGEHWKIERFPQGGLFAPDFPPEAKAGVLPFRVRWESLRVALACDAPLENILPTDASLSEQDSLWMHFRKQLPSIILPARSSTEAWTRSVDVFDGITLQASLSITYDARSGLRTKLKLEPLKLDAACRFQRKFGGSRLLYLNIPSTDQLRKAFGGQFSRFLVRFREWLAEEKEFLDRTWRVFHIDPKKGKKSAAFQESTQRLVLFATRGSDLDSIQISDFLDWFIPLEINQKQPFCKAYARLDLGLSRTTPTVCFLPSQLRRVRDVMSNGQSDQTPFDDASCLWDDNTLKPQVMNDGCSKISLKAAKRVWSFFRDSGPVPTIFQARFGGAKGVWMTNFDYSDDSEWIEVSDSQLKFKPHPEDLDPVTYDTLRLTFEVVKYARTATSSTLHVSFLPILDNRGVPYSALRDFVETQMDAEREELLVSVQDPVKFRKWVHDHHALLEEANRDKNKGITWQGGLPLSKIEQIILLLESSFDPVRSPFLSVIIQQFVHNYFTKLEQKFTVPLPRSVNLIGIADPTGTLEPGQVHVSFSTAFEPLNSNEALYHLGHKDLLIARHPALRNSDIQKVSAIQSDALKAYVDVIVFPVKGSFPLAGKLQGGDYDGDVFWVCWDPILVDPFKNAPAPLTSPHPQDYGIQTDKTTLEDMRKKEPEGFWDRFLDDSMAFRLQPDLLGSVTNFHEKLSYAQNAIDSPGTNLIADIHDLLVDAPKNGYFYDEAAFTRYVRGNKEIMPKKPGKPFWKQALEEASKGSSKRTDVIANKKKHIWAYKQTNVIDRLFFEDIRPHNVKTQEMLESVLDQLPHPDIDLIHLYDREMELGDPAIRQELKDLTRENGHLEVINRRWNQLAKRDGENHDPKLFIETLDACYRMYTELEPLDSSHPIISRWMRPDVPGAPSTWELIKASALYWKYNKVKPMYRSSDKTLSKSVHKYNFIFFVAGRELAYIKVHSQSKYAGWGRSTVRTIDPAFYNRMKPKKGLQLPDQASRNSEIAAQEADLTMKNSDDDDEFFSALDGNDIFDD
ncbi:hypothetical protein K402DRAFT_364650 [Aulographum hederae CBS 113979]|uniref:RNA-dependent RNA polymerase n=1 Tax=Aulographum hederae CBS 113979 TaxID=1176131 RepID=A0A6G1GLA6_9PEZI|nr:hypothetical protein K402DRAFT_364650 [Aulographum hederae CBS 113979]